MADSGSFALNDTSSSEILDSLSDYSILGAGRALFGLCSDGSEVPVEIGLNPIKTAEGSFVLAAIVRAAGQNGGIPGHRDWFGDRAQGSRAHGWPGWRRVAAGPWQPFLD
jgi:hypothetical protein